MKIRVLEVTNKKKYFGRFFDTFSMKYYP